MAGAAKGFFDERSRSYQNLLKVEQAFRAIEFAMAVQAMAVDTAETGSSIANATERAAADTAAGAAKAFSYLGPFGFAAAAAIVAYMAALGVHKGGGGNAPSSAARLQEVQGTGTILGSSTNKSDSVQRSIDLMAANSNVLLDETAGMARSLRNIDDGISNLGAAIARQIGVSGGIFDTSGLKLGRDGLWQDSKDASLFEKIGDKIGNAVFGGRKKTTLFDQGLNFGTQTIGEAAQGVDLNAYQVTKTTKSGGILHSDKTKYHTYNTEVSDDIKQGLTDTIASLRDAVAEAAGTIGVKEAEKSLNAMTLNIDNISLKGLSGQEITDALNGVISKAFDDMATNLLPQIKAFQKVGEGAGQTLIRLATDYAAVDRNTQKLGIVFSQTGVASIAARERLVQLVGGVDKLESKADSFQKNFLSQSQVITILQKQVTTSLSNAGYSGIRTKEQFRDLVQSLDLTTEEGAKTFAELMDVSDAFAELDDKVQELANKRIDLEIDLLNAIGDSVSATAKERERELAALDESLRPLQEQVYLQQDLNTAYDQAIDRMRSMRLLTTDSFENLFEYTKYLHKAANAGVEDAQNQLPNSSSNTFLPGAKGQQARDAELIRELQELRAELKAGQISMAQYQADTAKILRQWNGEGMPETRDVNAA
jgi:hypothetical protein